MQPMTQLDDPQALDFTSIVKPGDTVVCAQGLAEPVTLTRRLVEQRAAIGRFSLFVGPTYSDTLLPEHVDGIALGKHIRGGIFEERDHRKARGRAADPDQGEVQGLIAPGKPRDLDARLPRDREPADAVMSAEEGAEPAEDDAAGIDDVASLLAEGPVVVRPEVEDDLGGGHEALQGGAGRLE